MLQEHNTEEYQTHLTIVSKNKQKDVYIIFINKEVTINQSIEKVPIEQLKIGNL